MRLAAIRDALDRAGLTARTAASVDVGPRPYEQVFDGIASGPRSESRARRGLSDVAPEGMVEAQAALQAAQVRAEADVEIIDVESAERGPPPGPRHVSGTSARRS